MGWGTHSWRRYLKYLKNPKQIFKYEEKTFSPTEDPANLDPHHRTMLQNYKEVPNWWYGICLGLSVIAAGACIYLAESTLPWYLFFLAIVIAYLYVVFFGALSGLLGFHVPIGSAIQLLGKVSFVCCTGSCLYFFSSSWQYNLWAAHFTNRVFVGPEKVVGSTRGSP